MANFEPAFQELLKWEGGFQKNSMDRGNWTSGVIGVGKLLGTKYGISACAFPEEDIAALTEERAAYLYRRDWWRYGAISSQEVANKLLNLAVNWQRYGGHGPAVHLLQQALNELGYKIDDDGCLGPETINAANQAEPDILLDRIREIAGARYQAIADAHPEERLFLKEWEKRAWA